MSGILLYHVTPILNIDSIEREGLRPDLATGRSHVVWMCDQARLPWALAHISIRKKCRVQDLMVCTLLKDISTLRNTRWQGVFTCRDLVIVARYQSSETWLKRIEREGRF